MGVSKVEFGGETLVDLTGDTVKSGVLLKGETAHGADGEPVEGAVVAVPTTTSLAVTEEGVSALDGTVGKVLNDKINQINGNLSGYLTFRYSVVTYNLGANTFTQVKFPIHAISGYTPVLFLYAGNGSNWNILNYANTAAILPKTATEVVIPIFNNQGAVNNISFSGIVMHTKS